MARGESRKERQERPFSNPALAGKELGIRGNQADRRVHGVATKSPISQNGGVMVATFPWVERLTFSPSRPSRSQQGI